MLNHPRSPDSVSLLIVGCGYLGLRVADSARQLGMTVWGTTRNRPERLRVAGIEPVRLDWNDPRTLVDLPAATHVLVAVAHDRTSGVDRFESQVGGLGRLIAALDRQTATPPDLCYISTTGVYHQTDGQWVDETSPTRPTRDGGRAHLMAEASLRRHRGEHGWTILRLSGIYGPGRVPRSADVIAGRPIASPEHGFLNLIHVEDAAAAVLANFAYRRTRRRMVVVSDDRPVVRSEFYREIARQTGSPPPRFVEPSADSGASFRSETNKRVWNRRLKRDLLPQLRFPTYREGLRDVLQPS